MNQHVVAIMPSDTVWTFARFDNDLLTPMMRRWLAEHVQGNWSWQHEYTEETRVSPLDKGWRLVFRFADENDAISFKLRWA